MYLNPTHRVANKLVSLARSGMVRKVWCGRIQNITLVLDTVFFLHLCLSYVKRMITVKDNALEKQPNSRHISLLMVLVVPYFHILHVKHCAYRPT